MFKFQLQKKVSEFEILTTEYNKIETEKIELEKSVETYKNDIFEKDREITVTILIFQFKIHK